MHTDSFTHGVQETSQLKLAHDFVQYTGVNIFLTGKAGTGKTTFLRLLREKSPKRMIVTAPTGVAAINAGGVTIHSFFQLPFGPQVMTRLESDKSGGNAIDMNKFNREKINIIRSLDLLVIDEISMVRADLLDAIDRVLRRYKNRYKPFGGVQLLMIGDLQQLAPVVKPDEWDILKTHYDTPFFFSSQALTQTQFISIELDHIFRQTDQRFISLLNKIRDSKPDREALDLLNSRYLPDFNPDKSEGYITLTTHNQQASRLNEQEMDALKTPSTLFRAEVSGTFPEYSYPTDLVLLLKPGAQVMFARNDISKEKRFYNGKIGTIRSIEDDVVYVSCPGEDDIATEPVEWHNYTYTIDEKTESITENLIGTFRQMPLKPAWAITIHKSQGLTFEKAIIDANAAFAHGQVYVALSRCRTLEGMVLKSRINPGSLHTDMQIQGFMEDVSANCPDENVLLDARRNFERGLLADLNDFMPIQRRLDFCGKVIRENEGTFQGNLPDVYKDLMTVLKTNILDVSRKFAAQMNQLLMKQPDAEINEELQERLIKACPYFSDILRALQQAFLSRFVFETDNKAVRKSIREAADKVEDEICFKLACLDAVSDGFRVTGYLEAKAKAGIDKTPLRSKKSAVVNVGKTEKQPRDKALVEMPEQLHPDLYELLRQWRNEKAEALRGPVYLILPLKSMMQISNELPRSLSELRSVKGMGDKKVQQYGADILSIVADYCEANGLVQGKKLFAF
jgi:hypothetical protein